MLNWTSLLLKTSAIWKTLLSEGKEKMKLGENIYNRIYLVKDLYTEYMEKNPQNSGISKQANI